MKKVSIIIPLYNEEKYIKDAINSILEQDYSNYEIIVIDDGSTDNSYNIVNNIKDKRIKLFRFKKNKGVGEARNLGIKKASGDYLAFLDADDYWEKDKLKEYKVARDELMRERDLTLNIAKKHTIEAALKKLKSEYIGDTETEFIKKVKKLPSAEFLAHLDKNANKTIIKRLESFYEQTIKQTIKQI